jgi:hypothetical protein
MGMPKEIAPAQEIKKQAAASAAIAQTETKLHLWAISKVQRNKGANMKRPCSQR